MYSHFSVILLCFSGVYCISSTIENLDLNELIQILKSETTIKEWETAMDQDIYYGEDDHTSKIAVNVKQAVEDFEQKIKNGDSTEFVRIRNIIKKAYQCTLTKYGSLTAFMILRDVIAMENNKRTAFNPQSSYVHNKYHLDFDTKYQGMRFQYYSEHNFDSSLSIEWYNVLAVLIEKNLGFKIKYKIYPEVFGKKFTIITYGGWPSDPDAVALNELICVLNEAIQIFDNFILDNCVQHDNSFLKKFQSLEKGVKSDFIELITHIGEKIADRSSNWVLYRDFSIPDPDSEEFDVIGASGGFVENVEFEISGLKMDFPNSKIPTEIYGHHIKERTPEPIVLKLVESTKPHPEVKIGMLLYSNNES